VCTLENFQWCGETCFVGSVILRGRRLPPPTVLPSLGAGPCLATAVVSLFVSQSLSSNGSIRHNINCNANEVRETAKNQVLCEIVSS
jgi:hypothetical protein